VLPVWHVREPLYWLRRYIEEGHDYIAIGGMVPESTDWLKWKLDQVWPYLIEVPKVHGFGMTSLELMARYRWHSVDSSSWLAAGQYGACLFRVENQLRKVFFTPRTAGREWHYHSLPTELRREVDGWLEPFGVTADQVTNHYACRDAVNAAVFQGLEDLGVI
jgi:hypothetical protein